MAEVTRSQKLGRKFFCSLSCSAKNNILRCLGEKSKTGNWHPGLKHIRQPDEFSPFRSFINGARSRDKCFSLTLVDLVQQWKKQEGKCPYTGWSLILPTCTSRRATRSPRNASLDRIDSQEGYIPGNIQFVAHIANMAKWDYTEVEMLEFCLAVSKLPRT